MRAIRCFAFPWVPLLAAACANPTLIVVEVDADLKAGGDIDMLDLVAEGEDGSPQIDLRLRLEADHAFPLEVVLEPSEQTPAQLELTVTGLKEQVEVASASKAFSWEPDQVNRVQTGKLRPLE